MMMMKRRNILIESAFIYLNSRIWTSIIIIVKRGEKTRTFIYLLPYRRVFNYDPSEEMVAVTLRSPELYPRNTHICNHYIMMEPANERRVWGRGRQTGNAAG